MSCAFLIETPQQGEGEGEEEEGEEVGMVVIYLLEQE
jgi:hypothetical protein